MRTTIVDKGATDATDHVRRVFNPPAPNLQRCGDITYLHTGEGWLYLVPHDRSLKPPGHRLGLLRALRPNWSLTPLRWLSPAGPGRSPVSCSPVVADKVPIGSIASPGDHILITRCTPGGGIDR